MSILIFLVVLFMLVLVHEFGHFIAAKRTGMRVDEFGIGFPPRIFGVKKGETLYSLNLLPIGGFVRIFGEDAVDTEGASDFERSFAAKSKVSQAIVLVAGVVMNVLFAWLLFSIALTLGTQTAITEANATESASLMVTQVLPNSPAAEAGLRNGIVVTSLRSEDVVLENLTPSSFSAFIADHNDRAITLTYKTSGEEKQVTLTPEEALYEEEVSRPAIGVALALIDVVSRPIHVAVYEAALLTVTSLAEITVAISKLLYDALQLDADLAEVAGPVGIVGLVGEASSFGLTALLMFTAFISLNLAVINLLPFPALDGGRLLFVFIEALKGSPINPKFAYALNAGGFALLILLMIAVTYNDILRIL